MLRPASTNLKTDSNFHWVWRWQNVRSMKNSFFAVRPDFTLEGHDQPWTTLEDLMI